MSPRTAASAGGACALLLLAATLSALTPPVAARVTSSRALGVVDRQQLAPQVPAQLQVEPEEQPLRSAHSASVLHPHRARGPWSSRASSAALLHAPHSLVIMANAGAEERGAETDIDASESVAAGSRGMGVIRAAETTPGGRLEATKGGKKERASDEEERRELKGSKNSKPSSGSSSSSKASKAAKPSKDLILREAVAQANKHVGSAVKVTLTSDVTVSSNLPALAYGARLVVLGNCGKKDMCAITGNGFQGFACKSGASLHLERVLLTGFGRGAVVGSCSGVGVNPSLLVRNCAFRRNNNTRGGAIHQTLATIQISSTRFQDNWATRDGGAVQLQRGGSLAVFNSVFLRNVAMRGGGGAIAGQVNALQRTVFRRNHARGRGGAVLSTGEGGRGATIMRCVFRENFVKSGGGGAVYLDVNVNVALSSSSSASSSASADDSGSSFVNRMCLATFALNQAPSNTSRDVLVATGQARGSWGKSAGKAAAASGGGAENRLHVCTRDVKPRIGMQSSRAYVTKSCTGCTGCYNDCSGRGTCTYDKVDGTPSCRCSSNYDPESSCAACKQGYSATTSCTTCIAGYMPVSSSSSSSKSSSRSSKTKCATCPALKGMTDLEVYPIIGGTITENANACATLCAKSRRVPTYSGETMPCQNWMWLGHSALTGKGKEELTGEQRQAEGNCAGMCLMRYTEGACSNSSVTVRRQNGYPVYLGSFDDGTCGP